MKGYVERNLRKNETVIAKCHVTWTAFVPIILRALLIIAAAWLLCESVSDIILKVRMPEAGDFYFGSEEWETIHKWLTVFFLSAVVASVAYAAVPIIRLCCIELVVTDKKIIGKTGVIFSNAIDAYLEKIDNFAIDETLFGRIFKYSTITVGTTSTTIKFPYMQKALEFKNTVMDCYDARNTALMKEQAELIHAAAKNAE
ncbi:MAG: PH domain-containing protein [Oscillospiraceae bacterium]|nr:PH domain-containing protein [Oscillospiraceae bacterium]